MSKAFVQSFQYYIAFLHNLIIPYIHNGTDSQDQSNQDIYTRDSIYNQSFNLKLEFIVDDFSKITLFDGVLILFAELKLMQD